MVRKSAYEIVSEAHDQIKMLTPTPEEIDAYADLLKKQGREYSVVTYSKSRGGDRYFIRLHNTWKQKYGGRVHVDVGYVDEKYVDQQNVIDTTHLMLDKDHAPEFIKFVTEMRQTTGSKAPS
ncbi:MAG TPA: hypothetical protein VJZ03_07055 [Candidatus Bathyarchaeia archaeon]|nr:hypothetical protein [Candidatus Bathyarchaeia archaeon]